MPSITIDKPYTACNGVNDAGLLHCPLTRGYRTRQAAARAARRHGLTHTVVVEGERAFDMHPID